MTLKAGNYDTARQVLETHTPPYAPPIIPMQNAE
jgi:hypothetical protein